MPSNRGTTVQSLLACLQLSVDVDEDAVLSGLRTIMYPNVAAKTESGCTDPATDCTLRTAAGCGCCLVPALPPGICSCKAQVRRLHEILSHYT